MECSYAIQAIILPPRIAKDVEKETSLELYPICYNCFGTSAQTAQNGTD